MFNGKQRNARKKQAHSRVEKRVVDNLATSSAGYEYANFEPLLEFQKKSPSPPAIFDAAKDKGEQGICQSKDSEVRNDMDLRLPLGRILTSPDGGKCEEPIVQGNNARLSPPMYDNRAGTAENIRDKPTLEQNSNEHEQILQTSMGIHYRNHRGANIRNKENENDSNNIKMKIDESLPSDHLSKVINMNRSPERSRNERNRY